MKRSRATFLFLILAFPLIFTNCEKRRKIVIAGSETMNYMLELLATAYNGSQEKTKIEVQGGGSLLGIEKLVNGQVDVAGSSNDVRGTILEKLANPEQIQKALLGYDGVALLVHKSNTVVSVHLDQVAKIFSGEISNWKEIGGLDQPIKVYVRNDYSGTTNFLLNEVVRRGFFGPDEFKKNKEKQFTKEALVVSDNQDLLEKLRANPGGIGFVGMGVALNNSGKFNVKALRYAPTPQDQPVFPTIQSVYYNKYKLSRALQLLYHQNPPPRLEKFVEFTQSEKGQQIVRASGYLKSQMDPIIVTAPKPPGPPKDNVYQGL